MQGDSKAVKNDNVLQAWKRGRAFFCFSWKRVLRIINSMNIVDLAESGAFRSWTLERTSSWKVGVLWTQQCHPNGPALSFSCKYAIQETVKFVTKIC